MPKEPNDTLREWGEELEELINDLRRESSTDSVHIHEYVRSVVEQAHKEGYETGFKVGLHAGKEETVRKADDLFQEFIKRLDGMEMDGDAIVAVMAYGQKLRSLSSNDKDLLGN